LAKAPANSCLEVSISNPIDRLKQDEDNPVKYMLLIYDAEEECGNLSEAERGRIVNEYMQLTQRLKSAGNYLGSAQLRLTSLPIRRPVSQPHRSITATFPYASLSIYLAHTRAARTPGLLPWDRLLT
jgi:hypothetical protein